MPQIRCPKCGLTGAVKQGTKTFTQLLHITGLPRKTLSLRLNKLCRNGVLTKAEGIYQLKGDFSSKKSFAGSLNQFSKVIDNRKFKRVTMLMVLLLSFSAFSYALATLFSTGPQEPKILGTFTAVLRVNEVRDLYAWQAIIIFNPNELEVIQVASGEFFEANPPFFLKASDVGEGILMLGCTLQGDVPGKNGSGILATIVFGYFVNNYEKPQVVKAKGYLTTLLLNSDLSIIPINDSTLTLDVIESR